jgi:LCP family protein required for cell wall assembly
MTTGVLAGMVALVLVGGSLYAYARYRQVWESIKRQDVTRDVIQIKHPPPPDPRAVNILLIGSDSRSGGNGAIGGRAGIDGQRSDTVMVLHVAAGAHRAVVLSFPRDSVVPVYSCTPEQGAPGQTAVPGEIEQLNATFAYGGPGCLWKTVEETTHIHINDFIELTFVGFEKVIDDLGGVSVCLPQAVDDPLSGLNLPAGRQRVWGREALAFWRTREDLGSGMDTERIQRDQFLMAALLQGIEHSGLLTSTTKIASVVSDVARHMTTDTQLTQSRMLSIAGSLHGLTANDVQFIEVPWELYPANSNWVQWQQPQAAALFSSVAHDTQLPADSGSSGSTGKTGTAGLPIKDAGSELSNASHAKVGVEVLNGSTIPGLAASAAAKLTRRGFRVLGRADAASPSYVSSVVEYSSAANLSAARALKGQISGATIQRNGSVAPGTMELIVGSDFTGLKAVSATTSPTNLTKTYGGIRGNVGICQDKKAFSANNVGH